MNSKRTPSTKNFCNSFLGLFFVPIFHYTTLFINKTQQKNWRKAASTHFPKKSDLWHYEWHPFLWMWVPARESLCLFWRETHTMGLRTRTGMTREGKSQRSVGRWEVSQETDTVSRREQKETSRQNRSVKRWESGREETNEQKSERWLLRPVDLQTPGWPTREFKSAFLVALWEFSLEYTLALAHRMHKKCYSLPPSCAWSWPKSVFVCSFSFTLSVVFCVSVKKCERPLARGEKNH